MKTTVAPMKFKDVAKRSREALISVLERNDRNGTYSDEDRKGEGWPVMSKYDAETAVYEMLVAYQDEAKIGGEVSFDQLVAGQVKAMLDELRPMLGRQIPKSTHAFEILHDYIDANMLGGSVLLLSVYGLDQSTDVFNMASDIVDRWLALDQATREQWEF